MGAPSSVRRVLVANRGEIACRIIRTLDRMAIESVAVYSEADLAAPHVGMATTSVLLGAAPPAVSYRSTERLLAAIAASGADAVHPGYGFLAEDAEFAAAVEQRGVAFIGPAPEQVRNFGNKTLARKMARDAQVRLLPGSDAIADSHDAHRAAETVGYPLLVKSVAGGGGIGMLECAAASELEETVERAMQQAERSFGDRRVFLERFVERARHVEVQVFGDGEGLVAIVGERDCSTQRRRQKVIEEAPAPHLDDEVRRGLHDAARRLLEPQRYRSAGTVEFVVDADTNEFFFLEVNTRLQVEHGVTEAITGIDLVEWMVRLAGGDASAPQSYRHEPRGHAIEARIYAEDPARGFLPCAGLVTHASWPPNVRVDTWVARGTEVTPHYDPLLAKVIACAPTRADAAAQLANALDATDVQGIETNVALLRSFVASNVFDPGPVVTTDLEQGGYVRATIDVLAPGSFTSVQDFPGRTGYWDVGVPPSGPMDDASFRLGNELLGNDATAPGLECTASGPTLQFNVDTYVCLTGAHMPTTVDGVEVPWYEPVLVPAGASLAIGAIAGPGLRAYLLVRHGITTSTYLGSASTFTLGRFGGHGGRTLQTGDVLHVRTDAGSAVQVRTIPRDRPVLTHDWELAVVDGPHAAPEFFTSAGIAALYDATWKVHYNSSRTGVRLIGPKPQWARPDGGEAGLHPSNIHDTPYTVGAVDFTGDMPILLGPDGPSLGGFVCPFTIAMSDRWKLGQLAPGDNVRFVSVEVETRATQKQARRRRAHPAPAVLATQPAFGDAPSVLYRRSGDRALLVEYGPIVLDLDLRLRVHALMEWLRDARLPGLVEVTPGIRSLQIQVDDVTQDVASLLPALRTAEAELPALDDYEVSSRTVALPLSWDDPATREAIARYMQSVRDDAPWCPWNIEFIRRINGLDTVDEVHRILFDAEYLVLGLGDVYLGAPVAVPVDPTHRLVTTKYNPARTWTPENAVGIGGAYLCIYGMEGPGGYQFVGRTVPVWYPYRAGPHTSDEQPWLLRFFDRIRWYPVGADELLDLRAEASAGRLELSIEDGRFRARDHHAFLDANAAKIARFRAGRERAFAAERTAWEAAGEFARSEELETIALPPTDSELGALPDGAVVVESSIQACVWRIHVREEQVVGPGEPVVTVEAMKMEMTIASPTGGVVERIVCHEGQLVAPGAPLVVVVADT